MADELVTALHALLASHQKDFFNDEISQLSEETSYRGALLSLTPFFEKDSGLLRVGGRLAQSDHSNDLKFPILIDGKSHLATLLIRQAHTETMHGGPQATLSHLRQRYWITGGKKASSDFGFLDSIPDELHLLELCTALVFSALPQ